MRRYTKADLQKEIDEINASHFSRSNSELKLGQGYGGYQVTIGAKDPKIFSGRYDVTTGYTSAREAAEQLENAKNRGWLDLNKKRCESTVKERKAAKAAAKKTAKK